MLSNLCAYHQPDHKCPPDPDVNFWEKPPKPLACAGAPDYKEYFKCWENAMCSRMPETLCCREPPCNDPFPLPGVTSLNDVSSLWGLANVVNAVEATEPPKCCDFPSQMDFLQCVLHNTCQRFPEDPQCKSLNPPPPPKPFCCEGEKTDEEYQKCLKDLICERIRVCLRDDAVETIGTLASLVEVSSLNAVGVVEAAAEPPKCCDFPDQNQFLTCVLQNACAHSPDDPNCKAARPGPPLKPLCCEGKKTDEEYDQCLKDLVYERIHVCMKDVETISSLSDLADVSLLDTLGPVEAVLEPSKCCDFPDRRDASTCLFQNACRREPDHPNCKRVNPPLPPKPFCCDTPDFKDYERCMWDLLCERFNYRCHFEALGDPANLVDAVKAINDSDQASLDKEVFASLTDLANLDALSALPLSDSNAETGEVLSAHTVDYANTDT